jgi:hypothetical protein
MGISRAGKRGGNCQWVPLDDEALENSYQLAAPEGMTAEKIFDARWAAALFEATFARLRGELQSEGKGHLFEALQGFLLGRKDASYQQVADTLSLSLGGLKRSSTVFVAAFERCCAKKWRARSRSPRRSTKSFATFGPR